MLNTYQAYAAKDIFISPPQPTPSGLWKREQKANRASRNRTQRCLIRTSLNSTHIGLPA